MYGSFLAESAVIGSDIARGHLNDLSHVNFGVQTHFAGQDLEDLDSRLFIRHSQSDLLFKTTSTTQALVNALRASGGTYHNDISLFLVNFIKARGKLSNYSNLHIL